MLNCHADCCNGNLIYLDKKSNLGSSYKCDTCDQTYCIRDKDIIPTWQNMLQVLAKYGLEPFLYCNAVTTDSYYIKFDLDGMRSLRVSDHPGKAKYGYKWNLRSDITKSHTNEEKGYKQFFYHVSDFKKMIEHMIRYKHYVEQKRK